MYGESKAISGNVGWRVNSSKSNKELDRAANVSLIASWTTQNTMKYYTVDVQVLKMTFSSCNL